MVPDQTNTRSPLEPITNKHSSTPVFQFSPNLDLLPGDIYTDLESARRALSDKPRVSN